MRINRLSARTVATAPPGKHCDGGGLWLIVGQDGTRAWVLRYTLRGKRRELGLGPAGEVPLAEARRMAREARAQVRQGVDPKAERDRERAAAATAPTFREVAKAFIARQRPGWSNERHAATWWRSLEAYAFPVMGDLPVDEIEVRHVLEVLRPIWTEKTETASRVRGRIERVLNAAAVLGHRPRENPAAWRNNLDAVLPSPATVRRVTHHRALPWRELPAFMSRLRQKPGSGARALEFAILTAARSGEVRGATWAEIDLEAATWTVPADRMKGRHEHRVPLSAAALELLRELPRFDGVELLFPSPIASRKLSDMTLLKVCRDLEVEAVPHGFRSTFRDWAAEATAYPRELAEVALAHRVAGKTEAAYWRSDLFEKRRRLMEDWGAFCTSTRAKVVPIRRGQGA